MAEKIEEMQFCGVCSADVRPNSLFCYNCGSQVASDEEVAAAESQNGNKVSGAWFKETISDVKAPEQGGTVKKVTQVQEKTETGAIPKPTEILPNDSFITDSAKSPGLKTAASFRNRPKRPSQKKIQVTWESHETAPNFWFLIISLVLVIFAALVLWAMLYIR